MKQDVLVKSFGLPISNGLRHVLVAAISITAVTLLASCANAPALDATPSAVAAVAADVNAKAPARKRPPGPPVAPVRIVTETHFGQSVPDPYRYMEDVTNPEVVAFMRAQGEHTRDVLDRIPGRAKMAARIAELSDAGIAISGVQLTAGNASTRVFYYKIAPGETMRKLYVRDGFSGVERLLFDAQSLSVVDAQSAAAPKRWALDFFRASPNGAHVVVGVAAGGSEETSLRVIEVASGKPTGAVIDRIGFANGLAWTADSKAFFLQSAARAKIR